MGEVAVADLMAGWLRPGAVARQFGVSYQTLCKWIRQGKLEVLHTPNGRLVSRESVAALEAARAASPP